jgi:hypothetical protein
VTAVRCHRALTGQRNRPRPVPTDTRAPKYSLWLSLSYPRISNPPTAPKARGKTSRHFPIRRLLLASKQREAREAREAREPGTGGSGFRVSTSARRLRLARATVSQRLQHCADRAGSFLHVCRSVFSLSTPVYRVARLWRAKTAKDRAGGAALGILSVGCPAPTPRSARRRCASRRHRRCRRRGQFLTRRLSKA